MAPHLIMSASYNALLAIFLYILDKKTAFSKTSHKVKQLIIGVLFGLMAIFATTTFGGFDVGDGTIMNVRDAAPLCAGLIFGAPAGIIAGLIGGIYRFVAVYFGLAGTYTQIACSVSTILAGFIAAILRTYMFDDKKPTWLYGMGIGMVTEVLHMLMIFFTNMDDAVNAFEFVKICTLPMVIGNGLAVGIAVLVVSLIGREKSDSKKEQKQISQTFQSWLLICIIIAFVATSSFSSVLQTGMSEVQTNKTIEMSLSDVYQDILDESNNNLLKKTENIKEEYLMGATLSSLAEKYNVIEVNIIDENGYICDSNVQEYIGYDMTSGEQSNEFVTALLKGKESQYIQDYRPTSYDDVTFRKYGAIALSEGGFIQVGYDSTQFRADIDKYVKTVSKNRHVGNSGFVAICDENFNLVTYRNDFEGAGLQKIGITFDPETTTQGEIFESMVYDKEYLCAYRFVEGYYIVGAMPKYEAMFMKEVSVYVNTFMEILIFAALFVLIYFLIKRIIIDNLRKINKDLAEITSGNLNVTVNVRSNEEFASLSDDINQTVGTLKRYIKEAAARIDKELEFAKQIQYSSLPTVFPKNNAFKLYAEMITAKEVGGDFYDFYMLSDSTIAFLVADVSGKGIPAAMFMMRAKTVIRDLAEQGLEPDEIFTIANEKLCENNDAGMFVTAWLGILDTKTGLMKFANAGHNPPLFKRGGEEFSYLKARSGMLLAGMEGIRYRKNELQLAPGDKLYLYTDGVTEATNNSTELYGEQRLLDFVNSLENTEPNRLCKLIKEDVDQFVGTAPQFDDITMLALDFDAILGDESISVIPDSNSHVVVGAFADSLSKKIEIVPKIANKINIVFDEVYANIVNYSKATLATVCYSIESGKLRISFIDNGIPYNPLEATEPDTTLSAEKRAIGGLGIFMVKKMTESMEYEYENGNNILTLAISLS
ncbi:MAG: hypothetical protein E7413_05035 [Ruminococcaceae bacterium]|nr:hypothetical protein [Oscillospiraceae bacterium]